MENLYGISDSKLSKRSSMSPVQNFGTQNPYYCYKSPLIDQYASPDRHTTALKNMNSPYLRYVQSARSLLSSPTSIGDHQPSIGYKYHRGSVTRGSENSPRLEPPHRSCSPSLFRNTGVKVEEDVLVMDGVVVKNPAVESSRSSSSSLTESGGSSSSSSPGGKSYKLEFCVSYMENSGYCRYGSKCQFAHGKKELWTSQFPYKSRIETPCKSYNITATSPTSATSPTQNISPTKVDELTSNISNLKTPDWSPSDDGIHTRDPSGNTLSNGGFDDYISKVLYGPTKPKRLLVFVEICPEE